MFEFSLILKSEHELSNLPHLFHRFFPFEHLQVALVSPFSSNDTHRNPISMRMGDNNSNGEVIGCKSAMEVLKPAVFMVLVQVLLVGIDISASLR